MEVSEAVQGFISANMCLSGNMDNLTRVVSVGVLDRGTTGSIATESDCGMYRIVARYEDVAGPPTVDISTEHRVFWDNDSIESIKKFLTRLIREGKSFITRTGDGSGENPIIILKWERENRTVRAFR